MVSYIYLRIYYQISAKLQSNDVNISNALVFVMIVMALVIRLLCYSQFYYRLYVRELQFRESVWQLQFRDATISALVFFATCFFAVFAFNKAGFQYAVAGLTICYTYDQHSRKLHMHDMGVSATLVFTNTCVGGVIALVDATVASAGIAGLIIGLVMCFFRTAALLALVFVGKAWVDVGVLVGALGLPYLV